MAKRSKTVRVTEEELAALKALREGIAAKAEEVPATTAPIPDSVVAAQKALADAFVEAIERTKPKAKRTIIDRVPKTPWSPAEGSPRSKMKRKFYQHGLIIDSRVSNEEIDLLNKLKPGRYCDGHVIVTLRKDRGIDIDYPVRTAAQRLKLVNGYKVTSFKSLLERIVDEKANPAKYRSAVDKDLYDLDE